MFWMPQLILADNFGRQIRKFTNFRKGIIMPIWDSSSGLCRVSRTSSFLSFEHFKRSKIFDFYQHDTPGYFGQNTLGYFASGAWQLQSIVPWACQNTLAGVNWSLLVRSFSHQVQPMARTSAGNRATILTCSAAARRPV